MTELYKTVGHTGLVGRLPPRQGMAMLTYTIHDPIAAALTRCIEVTIDFGGRKRWLFFATPLALASVGDWVEGTRVRLHLGEKHMIVVSELTESIIDKVLRHLDDIGELEERTLPLELRAAEDSR